MDETIAPGVIEMAGVVGRAGLTGLSAGADALAGAVMGEQTKDETKAALSTLSRAFFNSTSADVADQNGLEDPMPTESHFPYVPSHFDHRASAARLQEPFLPGYGGQAYQDQSWDIDSLPVYSVQPRSDYIAPDADPSIAEYINNNHLYADYTNNNYRVNSTSLLQHLSQDLS